MLISSPPCSLNCQGLSIHLPPLGSRRDTKPGSSYRSPPMSDSLLQQTYDRPSPKLQDGYAEPSVSPPTPPSTLGKRSPSSPKAVRLDKVAQDERVNLSTSIPSGTERGNASVSKLSTNDTNRALGDSNDELSANSQGSPEAHQLMPGVPGVARRAKAHVPSACVNCKKKHLACETKRPCNRCMQTGKEVRCSQKFSLYSTKNNRRRLVLMYSIRNAVGLDYGRKKVFEDWLSGQSILPGN